jgi:hypothetical protein
MTQKRDWVKAWNMPFHLISPRHITKQGSRLTEEEEQTQ